MERRGAPFTPETVFKQELDLSSLDEHGLYDYIHNTLIPIENSIYTGGNSPEHKLLFMVGDATNDVTAARTSDKKPLYTNVPLHPKAPEISEATAAISSHFELRRNAPRVLSEVADIFYNLAALSYMDHGFGEEYKLCIQDLSRSLGMSTRESLLLAVAKYKYRLVDNKKKNPSAEDRGIQALLSESKNGHGPVLPTPSDENIKMAYRVINMIGNMVLKPRLEQLKYRTMIESDVFPKNHLADREIVTL